MNLQELRIKKGLSQKALAEQSGVALRNIQAYEQGYRDIKKANATLIMKLMNVLGNEVLNLLK